MATTDTELKKLNKTVDEAVNILKMYVGNSAQAKNASEKQNKAFDKLTEVNENTEKDQKKQRAFVERTRDENGRFIKKKETQSNKIMGMAGSVKGMFGGVTKTLSTSLTSLSSGITQNLQSFFQAVKSQFLSLFGEESEWFDILNSIKDSVMGFAGWFAKGFALIFSRTPAWAKSMVSTLKDMYKLQIKQMKMDFMDASGSGKKDGGILSKLGLIFVVIGAALGGWIKGKLMSMTLMWKGLKITKIFQSLRTALTTRFTSITTFLTGKKGIVTKLWKVIKKLPMLGKLIKGLGFGLKWLGWPIALLMGVIDFIKGYASTEGSMFDKIKAGLWAAIEGFIELPVMFIGWVVEKVLGWFGIESEGVGDKIMGFMKNSFYMIIEGWELIFGLLKQGWDALISGDFIGKLFDKVGDFLKNAISGTVLEKWASKLGNAITHIVAGVHNFFVDFWNAAIGWISSKIPKWAREKVTKGLTSMSMSRMDVSQTASSSPIESSVIPETTTSPIEAINNTEKVKIENQKKGDKSLTDSLDKLDKSVNDSGNKTGNIINSLSLTQNGGGGGTIVDTPQIPDELDNLLLSVGNYNGGMD